MSTQTGNKEQAIHKKLRWLFMQVPEGGISDESARLLPDSLGKALGSLRPQHVLQAEGRSGHGGLRGFNLNQLYL